MTGRLFFLCRLSKRERQVVGLLRGSYPSDWGAADRAAVERLRERAVAAGFSIPDAASSYANADEFKLLGWIALLQRQRPDPEIEVDAGLRPFVLDCARRLDARHVRLDYRIVAQIPACAPATPTARVRERCRSSSFKRRLPRASVQGRALLLISARGAVPTSELKREGVSRQLVNLMYKRGLLDRVHTGLYVAAPDAISLLVP